MGNQVQFWHECWCGDQTIREDFPILFEIPTNREASVEFNLVRQQGGERSWDVRFQRDLNDWEMESMATFLHIVSQIGRAHV